MNVRSSLRRALWNGPERRPRAPVRIAATAAGFLLVGLALVVGLQLLPIGPLPDPVTLPLSGVLTFVVVVGVCVPAARYVDRRRFADYGFRIDRAWWADCAFGLALGAALQTGIFLVGWAAGWYRVSDTFAADGSFLVGFGGVLVLFLAVGVYEELLARGWLLTNLAEGFRFAGERVAVGVAVALSSAVFGLLHATNPGASALSTAIISLAGAFLALGYVLTGELAIPIGVHVTWNLFQGAVFGLGVSGLAVPATVIETRTTGPDLVTGGHFGPEAGLFGLVAILVGSAAIAGWVRWRSGDLRLHPRVSTPELVRRN